MDAPAPGIAVNRDARSTIESRGDALDHSTPSLAGHQSHQREALDLLDEIADRQLHFKKIVE